MERRVTHLKSSVCRRDVFSIEESEAGFPVDMVVGLRWVGVVWMRWAGKAMQVRMRSWRGADVEWANRLTGLASIQDVD